MTLLASRRDYNNRRRPSKNLDSEASAIGSMLEIMSPSVGPCM